MGRPHLVQREAAERGARPAGAQSKRCDSIARQQCNRGRPHFGRVRQVNSLKMRSKPANSTLPSH